MTTNPDPHKKLQRSDDRIIAGVCSGIAEYLNVDPTVVRVIMAVLTVFGGGGALIYLVGWLVMPDSSGTVQAGRIASRVFGHQPAARQTPAPAEPPSSGPPAGGPSTSHEPPSA